MFLLKSNRVLQGMIASALVLAGANACSRPDRDESGRNNSAALTGDTASTAPAQSTTTRIRPGTDTVSGTRTTDRGAAAGDTAPARIQKDVPRAATAAPSSERHDTALQGDSAAAGYRAMERDTVTVPESDSARVTEDTSEISQETADTASVETAVAPELSDTVSAGIAEDTSRADAQVTGEADISANADTVESEHIRPPEDPAEIQGDVEMARDTTTAADQIDTTGAAVSGGVAVEGAADTSWTETAADTSVDAGAEVALDAGRIRPPEDSTEILGQVTTDSSPSVVATGDTSQSDRVRPPEDSTELHGNAISDETADEQEIDAENSEAVAASDNRTDEVGAAAVGGTVSGAEAVTTMTREGVSCMVVDPESDEEVRWDMSSTPVTLNPCGLGSMVPSKIWSER